MFPLQNNRFENALCVCDDKNDVLEKRLQRRFIKKHAVGRRRLKQKFIENIDNNNNDHHVATNRRFRRNEDDAKSDDSTSDVSTDVETVLTDLADQDIVEVDIIMDDIYDEIKDLQVWI